MSEIFDPTEIYETFLIFRGDYFKDASVFIFSIFALVVVLWADKVEKLTILTIFVAFYRWARSSEQKTKGTIVFYVTRTKGPV